MDKQRELENFEFLGMLFCQHCKAIQKVNETPVKCWYNPLNEDGVHAFCASCTDFIHTIISAGWSKGRELKAVERPIGEYCEKQDCSDCWSCGQEAQLAADRQVQEGKVLD